MTIIHRFTIYTLCLLAGAVLLSCNRVSENPTLKQAESLIAQHPDSTLVVLATVEDPHELPQAHRADYYLLSAQAKIKNNISIYQDSLCMEGLSDAIAYFRKEANSDKLARTYYLRGRTRYNTDRETGDSNGAMQDFAAAREYAEKAGDNSLSGLIYLTIGDLYYTVYSDTEALENFKKARECYLRENDMRNEIILCGKLGSAYNRINQYDSALVYQRRALDFALANGDTSDYNKNVIAYLYKNIGHSYKLKGDRKEEKNAMLAAYRIIPRREGRDINLIINSISNTYMALNQTDSAIYYARQFTPVENETIREKAFRAYHWYKTYKWAGDESLALENLEIYQRLVDDIFNEEKTQSVLEIQKKYDKEVLENQYNQVLVQRLYLAIVVIAILLISLLVAWYLRNQIKRREAELTEAEQRMQTFRGMLAEQNRTLSEREEQLHDYGQQLEEQSKKISEQAERLQDADHLRLERDEKSERLKTFLMDKLDIARKLAQMNAVANESTRAFMNRYNKVFGQNPLDWEHIYPVINDLYDGFVDRLRKEHPDLEGKDLQLCCFVRAGFRANEMAVLLEITQNAVRVKQARLVKKMGFENAELFVSYLARM